MIKSRSIGILLFLWFDWIMIQRYDLLVIAECRIPVVRMVWDHVDWVRFPALRHLIE
jgi:hypothetical protein